MDSYQRNQWLKTLGTYVLVGFLSIQGYRIYKAGGFDNGFRNFRPAFGSVFGTLPVIGSPIRKWAYSRGSYYSRKAIGSRGKKYGRRKYYKRRGRRR